jgi:hypothetical protein
VQKVAVKTNRLEANPWREGEEWNKTENTKRNK